MSILLNVLLVIFVLVTLLMILVILMQRPKSEGLGAAFGGGVTENIFGAQTTNVLTKITGWLAGIFFFLTFLLSVLYARGTGGSGALRQELMKTLPAAPAASVTPGPANAAPAAPSPGAENAAAPAAGDQPIPAGTAAAGSPTGADMAVGAVESVPPPAQSSPAASPATTP
jgi:preprotein translocase subunit SecG